MLSVLEMNIQLIHHLSIPFYSKHACACGQPHFRLARTYNNFFYVFCVANHNLKQLFEREVPASSLAIFLQSLTFVTENVFLSSKKNSINI